MNKHGFKADLRVILLPEKRWYYVFPLVVLLVALSYWIGSLIFLPQATWTELVMYRPAGDNQVWPVVTALSKLNFGDPTDALNYGQGIGGFHAVILLPHALAYAIFGAPGYMVMDAILSVLYFVTLTLLLRRCNCGVLVSLFLATALATGVLQELSQKVGQSLNPLLNSVGLMIAEWSFPNLVGLSVFERRIPRPMITEIFLVLLLYLFLRQWEQRKWPPFKYVLAVGALMALLVQGDPYSFAVLGLVLGVLTVSTLAANQWQLPWRFAAGIFLGGLVCASYFLVQLSAQSHESAVRFGLADYPRTKILLLPGFASDLRVLAVGGLAMLLHAAGRHWGRQNAVEAPDIPQKRNPGGRPQTTPAVWQTNPVTIAWFCLALVAAGWLAQSVQLFLLGKGAQIFHYQQNTLPTFCSYAMLILLINLLRGFLQSGLPAHESGQQPGKLHSPRWLRGTGVALLLGIIILLGLEGPFKIITWSGVARAGSSPWDRLGAAYRPAFRSLDHEFLTNPKLKNARSFATFSHEVNFLLAAFHDKRAYLPDNGFTTLSDAELERRLCEVCKVCGCTPDNFEAAIQNMVAMFFWMGCCKYWCSSDYMFAPESDYSPAQMDRMRRLPKQAMFNLEMPTSERSRLVEKFIAILQENTKVRTLPQLIVLTRLEVDVGIIATSSVYHPVYTNEVFFVYEKIADHGTIAWVPSAPLQHPGAGETMNPEHELPR